MWRLSLSAVLGLLLVCSPAVASSVVLPFCGVYVAPDGSSSTHRGLDVAMQPGADVKAPLSGTVKFAGRVPGPHGGMLTVVTLECDAGVVTLLPLADTRVVAGDHISEGAIVGALSGTGDPSSHSSHLHLGLKKAGVYVDPQPLLAVVAPKVDAPDPIRVSSEQPVAESSVKVTAPTPSPAVVVGGAFVPSAQSVRVPTPQTTVKPVTVADAPAATLAPSTPAVVVGQSLAGTDSQESLPSRGLRLPATASAAIRLAAIPVAALLAAASIFAAVYFGTRKAFSHRVTSSPASDRLGTLLQHLKAGDTICGLTSCSGPLPSQSRSL